MDDCILSILILIAFLLLYSSICLKLDPKVLRPNFYGSELLSSRKKKCIQLCLLFWSVFIGEFALLAVFSFGLFSRFLDTTTSLYADLPGFYPDENRSGVDFIKKSGEFAIPGSRKYQGKAYPSLISDFLTGAH